MTHFWCIHHKTLSEMSASVEFFSQWIYFLQSLLVIRYILQWWKISFPSALSGCSDPAIDFTSRTISMLWATGSHSVFEVVCFSLPWSPLPSQYFTSLKAVFPSLPAYNWGMAAIVVQRFSLNNAEFCNKCIHQDFLLCMQFWILPWCLCV